MLIDNPQHTNFFTTCLSLFGVVGFAGNFRQVNPAWKKVLGYTNNDIYKSLYLDLVHPRDKAKTEATLETLSASTNFVSFTNRFRRQDGTYRDILWEATRSETEPVFHLVGVDLSAYNAEVQQEVKLAKEDFEYIMENKREGVLDWNLLTNQVHYSPRWHNMVGFMADELGTQIELWYSRIHPNDYSKVIKEVELCVKDKTHPVYDKTHRIQHKDGSYRWAHSQGTVLRDNTGQGYRFLISFIDITERKRMEDALYTSEKFAKLFLCQAEAVLLVTPTGRILDANPAASQLYDYTREELLSFTRAPIFIDGEKLFAGLNQHSQQSGYQKKKNGTMFPVEMMVGTLEWQGKKLFIFSVRDMTSTRKALEALAESEMRYRMLFDSQPEALIICEAHQQRVVEVNTAAIIMYGYKRDEWEQLGIDMLVAHPQESLTTRLKDQKLPNVPFEWHVKKDGSRFPVEIAWSSYKFKGRNLMCFAIRDVTARKQKEEELYRMQLLHSAIFQGTPVFVMALTLEGKILTLNDAFLQIIGYPLEDWLDQDYLEALVPRNDQLFVADAFNTLVLKRQEVVWQESAIKLKNKPPLPVEWHYRAVQNLDGKVTMIVAVGINLSERKQGQQQLRLFKRMVENTGEAMMVRKPEGRLVYYNQAYEQLFNCTSQCLQALDFNDFAQRCTPDTRQLFEQEITPQLREGKTWEGVLDLLDSEGLHLSVWHRLEAIRDEQGNLLLFFGLMHDVTEKQALEAKLHADWEQYETIFHAAPVAIIYKDKKNRIVKVNRYTAQLWNSPAEKLVGRSFTDLESQLTTLSAPKGGSKSPSLHRYQDRYYQMLRMPYQDLEGQSLGSILFLVDVTERVLAEQALQRERDQYQTIFNAAPLAMMYKDRTDHLICANHYAAQRWNISQNQLAGLSLYDVAPEYAEKYHADDIEILETGEPQFGTLAEYAEGFYWRVDKIPYRDTTGNILGILVFAVDVTEHIRTTQQLRHQCHQYETIFHAAPFAIWYKDRNDRLLLVNRYVAKLWETTPEKLEGMSFHDLEPEYANRYQPSDLKVIYSGKPELGITEEYFQVDWLVHKLPYRTETGYIAGLIIFAMDVTEQVQTERGLRHQIQVLEKKEASLRQGIQNLPIMVYAINGEGNLALWNRKCEQVTGYRASNIIDNPKAWELLYPDTEYREKMLGTATELLKHHENWQHWQWTLTCQNGIKKKVAWSMNNQAEDPKAEELELEWVVGEDITEHEQTLQDLLGSEKRLQMAIENLPMMIDALDEDGNLVVWNQECERVIGYAKAEIVGNPRAWELLYPDAEYREQVFQTQKDMLDRYGGIRHWELNVTCKDGSSRKISWSVSNEVKMSGFALWFIGQDVTEQEQMLERFCDSEERLWLLIQHIPIMLKVYDEQGRLILWNRHCEEVTGYSAAEVTHLTEERNLLYPLSNASEWPERQWLNETFLRRETEITCQGGTRKTIAWSNVSKQFSIPGWHTWLIGEDVTGFRKRQRMVVREEAWLEAA